MSIENREYVKLSEVPEFFGLSRHTMYKAEKEGKITIHRGSGVGMIRKDELRSFIEGVEP